MRALPLVTLACLGLAGCAGGGQGSLPLTPASKEDVAAARTYVSVVDRVEPVAERECRSRNPSNVDCDLHVIVDDRPGMPPNAFQMLDPEGHPILGITVALIQSTINDDELAFVISHEASHHILGHLARSDELASVGAKVFGELASEEVGATPASVQQAREVGAALGVRTYSKDFELEADALGAVIAQEAGFDPLKGAQFFLRIPDPGNRFLATHPPNAARIAVVQAVVDGRYVP